MRTRIGRPAINGGVRGTAVGLAKAKPAFGPPASPLAAAAAAATPAASAAPTTVDPIGPLQEVTRVPVYVTVQQRSVELKISGSVVRRIHGTQNDGRLRSKTGERRRRRARGGRGGSITAAIIKGSANYRLRVPRQATSEWRPYRSPWVVVLGQWQRVRLGRRHPIGIHPLHRLKFGFDEPFQSMWGAAPRNW